MTYQSNNDIRCPVCLAEFNATALLATNAKDCPNCHTLLYPMLIKHDGYVKLNWQDLRVLV